MTLFSIKSNQLTAHIKSFGAELSSVQSNSGFEFMWQANPDIWPRHAPILFPVVGRFKNFEYSYQDAPYRMNQHGFARDSEFKLLQRSEHSITLILKESSETLSQYPFRFQLLVQYRLEGNALHQSFVVINRDHEVLPTSFGAHPAFRLDGLSNYYLKFNADETTSSLSLNEGLISEQVRSGITDGKIELTKETFNDDALIFNDLTSTEVSLIHRSKNHKVSVSFEEFPYLGVWAKPGADFVCIEPWQGLADQTDHSGRIEEKAGILWIEPGQQVERSFTMRFESE
jgi:galactose mutarotase-like enzyme